MFDSSDSSESSESSESSAESYIYSSFNTTGQQEKSRNIESKLTCAFTCLAKCKITKEIKDKT